jgi:hypothetical protein
MPTTETLPAVDACIDLYVRIYDCLGDEEFAPDELADLVIAREGERTASDAGRSTDQLLDLLVAYGLLSHRDGCYRVRCAPDETLDRWRAKATARAELLHRSVEQAGEPSRTEPSDGADRAVLTHDGDAFARVRLADADDLTTAETRLSAALDSCHDCVGVVLCAPGELAAEVQRFADRQCDSETGSRRDRSFEKATTDLVGEDKNHLEFRLFLREVETN